MNIQPPQLDPVKIDMSVIDTTLYKQLKRSEKKELDWFNRQKARFSHTDFMPPFKHKTTHDIILMRNIHGTRMNLIKNLIELSAWYLDPTDVNLMKQITYDENGHKIEDKGFLQYFLDNKIIGGSVDFGDFEIPQEILDYIFDQHSQGLVPEKNIANSSSDLEVGKVNAEKLKNMIPELSTYAVLVLLGMFHSENGWDLSTKHYSDAEAKGGGTSGTGGYSGCGEGWFGVTHWTTKKQIIDGLNLREKLGLPVGYTEADYVPGHMLKDLPDSDWVNIFWWYVEHRGKGYKEAMLNENDKVPLICACYLFKAGNYGKGINLNAVDITAQKYRNTQVNGKSLGRNGFCCALCSSIRLAHYIKTGEVTKLPFSN